MDHFNYDLYVQVRQPDKEKMKIALLEIKGMDRKMSELAKETELGKVTLSRILNENYTKPISPEILEKLAASAAEGCTYDLEDLLEINGMVSKEKAIREKLITPNEQSLEKKKRFLDMEDIITKELFASGVAIKKMCQEDWTKVTTSNLFERGVGIGELTICLPEKGGLNWGFAILCDYQNEDQLAMGEELYVSSIFSNYKTIFLQDAWKPETLLNSKFSFVFADKSYYYAFIDAMDGAKLNNRMSAILINLYDKRVEEEQFFACKNFETETVSMFSQAWGLQPPLWKDVADTQIDFAVGNNIILEQTNKREANQMKHIKAYAEKIPEMTKEYKHAGKEHPASSDKN